MSTQNETEKRKKGRPTKDTESVNLRLPRAMLTALDDYRRAQDDLPNRPEAVRRLLSGALS